MVIAAIICIGRIGRFVVSHNQRLDRVRHCQFRAIPHQPKRKREMTFMGPFTFRQRSVHHPKREMFDRKVIREWHAMLFLLEGPTGMKNPPIGRVGGTKCFKNLV